MKLNKIFKWCMVLLIVISAALAIWAAAVGFTSNDGQPIDVMLYWAYVLIGIALGPGTRAVILETYGSGNAISKPWFIETVKEAAARGKILLNVTQCLSGDVDMDLYATGRSLKEAGVISGHDITTESALGKLFYLMGNYASNDRVKQLLEKNLKGEISK